MGTGHDEIGVGVLIAKVGKNFGIGTRIVADPVVVVDPDVAEHLHFVLHLLRRRRSCGAAPGHGRRAGERKVALGGDGENREEEGMSGGENQRQRKA